MEISGGEAEAAQTVGMLLVIYQFEVRTTTSHHHMIDLAVLRAMVPSVHRHRRPPTLTVQKEVTEPYVVALITAGVWAVRRVAVTAATAPAFYLLATTADTLDIALKMSVRVRRPARHVIVHMRQAGAFIPQSLT
jgi:hypothetical protein